MGRVFVTHKFAKIPDEALAIDTTSNSGPWQMLSPFVLPGGQLFDGLVARNVENAWQYTKLYAAHADEDGDPTDAHFAWRRAGLENKRAVRYPMGKGAKPLHSFWLGPQPHNDPYCLGYVAARRRIYAPLYARAVVRDPVFERLRAAVASSERDIYLRDWDGYDHVGLGQPITGVMDDTTRKMGHAFVLWMLLTGFSQRDYFNATYWLESLPDPSDPLWTPDLLAFFSKSPASNERYDLFNQIR